MSIFKYLIWPFKQLYRLFSGDAGKAIITAVDALLPVAFDIVKDLRAVDPETATTRQIVDLYDKYAVALPYALEHNRTSYGNALLNLATILVRRQQPGVSTTIAHAAIEIALAGLKAR